MNQTSLEGTEKRNMQRQEQEVVIANSLGLHARPAALFVQLAQQFLSEIIVEKDGEEVNGKSPIGLLMLCAGAGSKLKIKAQGDDSSDALEAIVELINNKFGEE